MAIINGTPAADTLVGTNDDDTIIGYKGSDGINGLDGNDTITGGQGADLIDGGAGDDTIIVDAKNELAGGEEIDGGAGDDTLVTGLSDGDDLNGPGPANDGTSPTIWGAGIASMVNMEFVQVSNASDFLLDLSADGQFAFDLTATGADTAAGGAATALVTSYTAASGAISSTVGSDVSKGVIIDGVTYADGETYTDADGGSVAITYVATDWTFTYTANPDSTYAVGVSGDATDDVVADSVVATVTDAAGNTTDVALTFTIDLDANFDATAATSGITSRGDTQTNIMTGSLFDDVIWAGPGDAAPDTLNGQAGNDILAGGGGSDIINGGTGTDTIYGGDGDDDIDGGDDNDVIWAGAGNDATGVDGGKGDDIIGGGDGDDTVNGGDGDDTIYAGSDDGIDTLNGDAGNDTIYGGDGADFLNGGDGDDLIFNGAGNDTTVNGGNGNDTLWGGAGDDTLTGGADDDTFGFIAGNGNDTVADFQFGAAAGEGDVLDLTAFGFADTQDVIDSMSDVGGVPVATLALGPGQTVTFTGFTVSDFQAAVDDWVLV